MLRVYSDEQTPYSTGYSYFIIENLKNQTTGIFSDFIIPDPKEIQIFDDFEFDGEDEFTLILKSFDYNNYTIELSSISESYFKYSQTLEQQRETKNDPIREKVVAYSNITGGLGIFGAINKKHLQVER